MLFSYSLSIEDRVSQMVQTVPAVQPLRSVQAPTSFLPRDAGEDEGGGLNGLNGWNRLNHLRLVTDTITSFSFEQHRLDESLHIRSCPVEDPHLLFEFEAKMGNTFLFQGAFVECI